MVARLAAGLAVAGLAAAVLLGLVTVRAQDQLEQIQRRDRQISAVLAAPDARILTATAHQGGAATVVVSRAEGELVFLSRGWPRCPTTAPTSCGRSDLRASARPL
ncbi:anti-sigma factor domain-containing protein [Streptosporangium lutulentum]